MSRQLYLLLHVCACAGGGHARVCVCVCARASRWRRMRLIRSATSSDANKASPPPPPPRMCLEGVFHIIFCQAERLQRPHDAPFLSMCEEGRGANRARLLRRCSCSMGAERRLHVGGRGRCVRKSETGRVKRKECNIWQMYKDNKGKAPAPPAYQFPGHL